MYQNQRSLFGVIAAQAADIEQREILNGIIEEAQAKNIDVAIISNIYNPNETSDVLKTENEIYDLILSEKFDGLILISESIINPDVQKRILSCLEKQSHIPVVVIGTLFPDFVLPHFHFINTSDISDLEDLTNHLIETHHMRNIHILTGHQNLSVSHKRIEGYRNALEQHGIPYSENNVFFGDFWMNSGREQAKKYISGKIPFPEALICCNDYMAYGFLDACMEQDIPVPEKLTVVGYEYIRERCFHMPFLTTYQRNRHALGVSAVQLLKQKLKTGEYGKFISPKGKIICGNTCSCGISPENAKQEIQAIQLKQTYDFLNLFSQLEHRLTECRNIEEFSAKCREFRFMIRNVKKLYLCLYENWYEEKIQKEMMICYNLLFEEKPILFHKYHFSELFYGNPAPYYFCPLFFSDRELGFVILGFDEPDTFDHIFRNWLKSIANGLEFLRMKNDIRYLMECQNLSEQRDTLTGMYHENGMKKAYLSEEKEKLYFVVLQICRQKHSVLKEKEHIPAVLDTAEAVRQFCGSRGICGRIAEDVFLCLVHSERPADFLENHLSAIMSQHRTYIQQYGMDSFFCCAVPCETHSYAECYEICCKQLEEKAKRFSNRRMNPHYTEMRKIRNILYQKPEETFDSEALYALYHGSKGYFRQIYRECYGITMHDDCISARISRAQYLLSVTVLSLNEIASRCGYTDTKYFMRQFQQKTGFTAVQYRSMTN